ncbi:uncharacterized protein LOC119463788 isoform X2 [Dermacentor silvarum]|uniref:uncharacterized protein LOC119463788 isoform X2 n=1 Tax=Dermacentor silvarum TaxID=543639 RepID=UPI002100CB92|nr:uncharacterized protein LOC119463788 isoform X2 [Dermacentor silvarum]
MSDANGESGESASSAAAAKRAARAEAQRRRRQNPEVRAAEAEAYRRRCRQNPAVRAAEIEAHRRRRQGNPAVRAAAAEAQRRRRQNPEVRAAEAEASRRRRQENPAVRAAEAEAKRRRREDLAVRAAEAEAKRRRRRESPAVRAAEAEEACHRLRREVPAVRAAEAEAYHCRGQEDPGDMKMEPASCCTHATSTKPVQTEATWLFNSSVDVAVETSRSFNVCKSTQTAAFKVHKWTETTDLDESEDRDTHVKEIPAPHVGGMPRLTNTDQSPGVVTLHRHQVYGQGDGTFVDCSTSPAAIRIPYYGPCIVRWCTNRFKASPGRLFRVPKDNRMEAFLRFAERPELIGLPKETGEYFRICSVHFTESDYIDLAKTTLKWSAVPSVKAPDELKAPHACGMPRLTNTDQSPGVATSQSRQVDGQGDGTSVDCSTSPAPGRLPYYGSCIVRWCTNKSPGRLFRVPKDNRMEAFLKYAERPELMGFAKEVVHYYRVCSAHFTESDYMDPAKTKLKWLAVPSVKAPDESKGSGASHEQPHSALPGALLQREATSCRFTCVVQWCKNTSRRSMPRDVKFYRIPKGNRICSVHFTEVDFMDPARRRLVWSAVPSVKAPDDLPDSESDTASPGDLREPPPQPGPSEL